MESEIPDPLTMNPASIALNLACVAGTLEVREKKEARYGDTRISLVSETKAVLDCMGQSIALLLRLKKMTSDPTFK